MLAITVIGEDLIYHRNEFATMFVSAAPSVPKTNLGLRITDPIASIECLESRASSTRWGWMTADRNLFSCDTAKLYNLNLVSTRTVLLAS
jgi:hypothetical protein